MKYIALLRGINVGGNNKVAMSDLKKCFEDIGFKNVMTYINSGNVIFETNKQEKANLVKICEKAVEEHFDFHIICSIISAKELEVAIKQSPGWWDNEADSKHNAIFAIAPVSAKEVAASIGEFKPEYESVAVVEPIIFWSAPIKTFGKTRYSKIVSSKLYKSITIRNANTTRRLLELCSLTNN